MNPSTMRRRVAPAAAVLSLSLALTACSSDDTEPAAAGGDAAGSGGGAELSANLDGAGASSQQAGMQAWIAGFSEIAPDVVVNYQPVGSGGGREQFTAGATDFGGTDAYLDDEELALAQEVCGGPDAVIEFPGYISPIAVVFNLPGIDTLNLPADVLARIFAQDITTWNDPAIAETNPDADLPDTAITVVNRSDESGTTENFVDYLSQAAPEAWTYEVSGDWPVSGGEAAQGTSGVVGAVTNAEGGITYADASQAGDLGVVAVEASDGSFTEYSPEAAAAIVDAATRVEGRGEYSFAYDLNRTPEGEVYPIALVSYELACAEYEDQETADAVKAFLSYVVSEEGQQASAENAGSAPISDEQREQAQTAIDAITVAG